MDFVRCESASGRGLPRPCALEDGAYCPLLTSTGSPPPFGDAELWNSRCQPAEASALGPWPLAVPAAPGEAFAPSLSSFCHCLLSPAHWGALIPRRGKKFTKEMNYAYGIHFLDE